MQFVALPTDTVRALQAGGPDAHGHIPERAVSNGVGTPCRHCLKNVPEGAEMLILAHRPFGETQPYAETGPIFLCADSCARGGGDSLPEILEASPLYLIKGYNAHHRIVYGTGTLVPPAEMATASAAILADADIAYVHVRSASNNCYLARIDRD